MTMSEDGWNEADVTIDLQYVLPVLATSLYGNDPRCAIRELALQNPLDATLERQTAHPGDDSAIHIYIDRERKALIIEDQGIGMTQQEIAESLARIGGTSKADVEHIYNTPRENQRLLAEERIGKFGMGFLAGFIIADKIQVRTRKFGSTAHGVEAVFTGETRFRYRECAIETPGTTVTLYLKQEYVPPHARNEENLLDTDRLTDMIRLYGDLLRYPVYVHRNMGAPGDKVTYNEPPWIQATSTDRSGGNRGFDEFFAHRYQGMNKPLAIIPVSIHQIVRLNNGQEKTLKAGGLLYIPDPPARRHQEYGVVDLYIKRMFVCRDRDGVLPDWAMFFVNGLIDTSSLTETLDRNDVVRTDRMFVELRRALGELLIRELRAMATDRPQDFDDLLTVHDQRIRQAALNELGVFFNSIAEHLPVTIFSNEFFSGKRVSLGSYLEDLAPSDQQNTNRKLIKYFSHCSRTMIKDLISQENQAVVDATVPEQKDLLNAYAVNHADTVEVQDVTQDMSTYIKSVASREAERWRQFVNFFHNLSNEGAQTSIRDFRPTDLPALMVLVQKDESAEDQIKGVLEEAPVGGIPAVARALRKELDRLRHTSADVHMYLNAGNPLLQNLLAYAEEFGVAGDLPEEVKLALHEVMHNARVYSGEAHSTQMTVHIFEHHNRLLDEFLNVCRRERLAADRNAEIEKDRKRHGVENKKLKGVLRNVVDQLRAMGTEAEVPAELLKELGL